MIAIDESTPIETRYYGEIAPRSAWPVWRDDGQTYKLLKPWDDAEYPSFLWGADIEHVDGADQLALAMIFDATGDRALTQKTYKHFARHVVAHFGFTWMMCRSEVLGIAQAIAAKDGGDDE